VSEIIGKLRAIPSCIFPGARLLHRRSVTTRFLSLLLTSISSTTQPRHPVVLSIERAPAPVDECITSMRLVIPGEKVDSQQAQFAGARRRQTSQSSLIECARNTRRAQLFFLESERRMLQHLRTIGTRPARAIGSAREPRGACSCRRVGFPNFYSPRETRIRRTSRHNGASENTRAPGFNERRLLRETTLLTGPNDRAASASLDFHRASLRPSPPPPRPSPEGPCSPSNDRE